MAPKITFIGGGSYQWTSKLLIDLVNMPSLVDAEVVIEDIDPAPIPRMLELVEHIAKVRGIGLHATGTTDQKAALEGADYVVVCISTGALAEHGSRHRDSRALRDQAVGRRHRRARRHRARALRNIPVMVDIARDMEQVCPDAWMLNLTNPMTTLTRSVLRETSINAVGLCHEVTLATFVLSLLLECDMRTMKLEIGGVNHLPIITKCDVEGKDGLAQLADMLEHEDDVRREPLAFNFAEMMGHEAVSEGGEWTKAQLLDLNQVKFDIFRRTGALPGAGDRHLVEFFSGFLTEESGWGRDWGVELTDMAGRERWQVRHIADFEATLAAPEISRMPSGEMVAGLIDSRMNNKPRDYPVNIANTGQVPDLPDGVVVESMCTVDASGVRGRDRAVLPPVLADTVRRVSLSQELTVEAAVTGNRDRVVDAMIDRPARGPHRLPGAAAHGRRDDHRDLEVAPTVRVKQWRVGELTVRVYDDVDALAADAAADAIEVVGRAIDDRGHANVMLATGTSQLVFLRHLVAAAGTTVDWSRVTGFHMDEYVGLPASHPASFERYMRERVVAHLPFGAFHYVDGDAPDPDAEAARYAGLLEDESGRPLLPRYRRERPPGLQRSTGRRLRRPAPGQGRGARRPLQAPTGG